MLPVVINTLYPSQASLERQKISVSFRIDKLRSDKVRLAIIQALGIAIFLLKPWFRILVELTRIRTSKKTETGSNCQENRIRLHEIHLLLFFQYKSKFKKNRNKKPHPDPILEKQSRSGSHIIFLFFRHKKTSK